jgi:hypothetical protein
MLSVIWLFLLCSGSQLTATYSSNHSQALECNSTLESLVLNENEITSAGCQALIGALRVNRTLRHLEFLPGNCAAPSDVKALARAVKRNRK